MEKTSRVEVIVLIPEETEEDIQSKEEILNDFRQAWQEAINREKIPIEQLWED